MASKNFCDICDSPAIGAVNDIEMHAGVLNKAEGTTAERYQNNRMQVSVSWRIANSYTDTKKSGHICAACLVQMLNKHIEQIKRNEQP